MDEIKAEGAESCPQTPPPWLIQMMQKMKQELKREILDELYGTAQLEWYQFQSAAKKEENIVEEEVIHHGVTCDICDQTVVGIRYKCGNCPDFDMCAACESIPNIHYKSHILMKIRYPIALGSLCHGRKNFLMSPFTKNSHHKKFFDVRFLHDETVPDGTVLSPSSKFLKSWKIINCGKKSWTHGTKLQLVQPSGLKPDCEQVVVPHLKPGEEGTVSVWFSTPSVPGAYKSCWNFCHKNRPFGDMIWCHVVVGDLQPVKLVETLQMPSEGLPDSKEQDAITQVLTAVKEEHDRGNLIPRKLAVSSHTATPTNTPFDLTPPKSPDHHAFRELKEVLEVKESSKSQVDDTDAEDESSIVSLSSSESDAEFVVIPMPKCFNLSESVSSQHISHLSQYLPPETVVNIQDLSAAEQKLEKSSQKNTVSKSATFSAESVSQETGVPEFSLHAETEQKILISHNVSADGSSSSEVSVIDSGGSSPTGEHAIPEIHVAITTGSDVRREESNVAVEDSTEDAQPSSATFPKFPVEGITTIYEPMSSERPEQPEQKTVQILPERLPAPINAAVSLFNTARGVISSLQHPSRSNPGTATVEPMIQLTEMGFFNLQQNEELLKKHNNNVERVVAELVSLNDNDWYTSRHTPPSPPEFD